MNNINCVDINGLNIEHSKVDQLLKGVIEALINVANRDNLIRAYSGTSYYDDSVQYWLILEYHEFMMHAFIKWDIRNYEQNNEKVCLGWNIDTVISEVCEEKIFNIKDGFDFIIEFIKLAGSK